MRAWIILLGLFTSLSAPSSIAAATPGSVALRDLAADLQEVLRAESNRLAEIRTWVEQHGKPPQQIFQGLPDGDAGPCATNCVAHRVEATDAGGATLLESLALNGVEVAVLAKLNPAPSFLEAYGASAMATQMAFNMSVENAGGPSMIETLMNNYYSQDSAVGDDISDRSSVIMNPFSLMASGTFMTSHLAKNIEEAQESLQKSPERAQAITDQKLALASQLRENGTEIVNGVEAIRFSTPMLSQPLPVSDESDGIEGEINRAHLLIDPDRKLILKQRTEGKMTRDGETQEFFVEVVNSDFRNPAGCGDLVKPFRRVTRLGGMMTEAERQQMAEARAQLDEFDRQLAALPPQQRQMMESMMGDQMEAVRSLASGGAMETTQEIEEIYCNPDLASLFGTGMGKGALEAYDLATIQEYLLVLGYEPGNTDGELDVLTEIAISTYQADRGMAVTGQPSLMLQQALAAEID